MTPSNYLFKAASVFFGLLLIEIAIDYSLRLSNSSIKEGGFNETIWFGLHLLFAAVAGYFLLKGAAIFPTFIPKVSYFIFSSAAIFGGYIVVLLLYIVSAGIDSL